MEQSATMFSSAPVKKSAKIILTVAASMGIAARGQQSLGPCDAAAFSPKVCKAAIHHKGFCSGGAWVPTAYQQAYPYYYDSYQAYLSGGGVATPASVEDCRRPSAGFFGAH